MNIKKYKKRIRILKLSLILVFIILGYFTYLFINSPKFKFISYIYKYDTIQNDYQSKYGTLFNNSKIGIASSTNIKSKYSVFETSLLNLNLDYYEDNDKMKNYINTSIDIGMFNKLKLTALNKNNKFYYTLDNIYDNYYYIDSNYMSIFKSNIIDKNIKKALIKSFFKGIDNSKFSTSNSNDNINDNDVILNKISLSLTNNDIKNVIDIFKSELLKSNDTGTYNYILNNIDSIFKNVENNMRYIYSLYESNNELVKQDLQIINNNKNSNIIITYYSYDNKKGVKLNINNNDLFYVLYTKLSYYSEISGKIGENIIEGRITNNNITVSVKDKSKSNIANIDGTIDFQQIKENVEYKENCNININLYENNKVSNTYLITHNINWISDKEVRDINTDKALENKNITDKDKDNLNNYIQNHLFSNIMLYK